MTAGALTETVGEKAARLLGTARVVVISVDHEHAVARVRGDNGIYDVEYDHGRWSCTCAGYGKCSHIAAVRQVTTVEPEMRP